MNEYIITIEEVFWNKETLFASIVGAFGIFRIIQLGAKRTKESLEKSKLHSQKNGERL
ncbi:MAG: hypothetical protein HYV45_03640 [Candidatus Moranbacteria bacterium]|nr:hypothetical protein [Candidatus Moranbacteria bacterium]